MQSYWDNEEKCRARPGGEILKFIRGGLCGGPDASIGVTKAGVQLVGEAFRKLQMTDQLLNIAEILKTMGRLTGCQFQFHERRQRYNPHALLLD